MRRKRLLWQLYPAYLIITLLAVVTIGWYSLGSLRGFYYAQVESDLEARARLLEFQLPERFHGLDESYLDSLTKSLGKLAGARVTLLLPSGEVAGDSEADPRTMSSHIGRPEVVEALAEGIGRSRRFSETVHHHMMYLALPVVDRGQTAGVLRVALPLSGIDQALWSVGFRIVLAGLVVALAAAIMSLYISRRFSRPLEEMQRGAERFAQGDLSYRLKIPGSEEIGRLAEAMNAMAAQLSDRIRSLAEQHNKQEALLSSMVEGVLAVDSEERLITLNRAAAELFGVQAAEVQGRSLQEVIRNPALQRFVRKALSSRGISEGELVLEDGEERVLQAHGTVLQNGKEQEIGALIVLNEVTHVRRLETMRRDFVANVSHELKTPITSIKGFVETLREGALKDPDAAERFLAIIAKQSDRLNAIIEDLLSLSRIEQEAEKEQIQVKECKLRDVLRAAIQDCEAKAAERQVKLALECWEELTAKLNHRLLEQAVVNLIDNAIKYSDAGSTVEIDAAGRNGEIVIEVRDQGCGIAREHLPRLFERFYRADKARSRKLGGTGLGLAIVKHIAQAHGGRVTVDSAPGKGSTFGIHLPEGGRAGAEGSSSTGKMFS
jgi:two-component system phosphate regulon sensor histidine kinase PhoR